MKNILQFDEFNEDGKHALCSGGKRGRKSFSMRSPEAVASSKGVIGVGVFKKINPPDFQLN